MKSLQRLVTAKSGESHQPLDEFVLRRFGAVADGGVTRDYLRWCVPNQDYFASGLRVLGLGSLLRENLEAASPGQFIFPFGYLTIATSVGGNALCLDGTNGQVVWAAHDSFFDGLITYRDHEGQWVDVQEYSPYNVALAVRVVDRDAERFLWRMLRDEETQRLDSLDLA